MASDPGSETARKVHDTPPGEQPQSAPDEAIPYKVSRARASCPHAPVSTRRTVSPHGASAHAVQGNLGGRAASRASPRSMMAKEGHSRAASEEERWARLSGVVTLCCLGPPLAPPARRVPLAPSRRAAPCGWRGEPSLDVEEGEGGRASGSFTMAVTSHRVVEAMTTTMSNPSQVSREGKGGGRAARG